MNQQVNQTQAEPDSARGYWRLNTQATTRTTWIQFYGPAHQLLYEEILPGKWVNLSQKNQKRFDQLLAQLVTSQLLAGRVKIKELPASPDVPTQLIPKQSGPAAHYAPETTSYQVYASINQAGKLYLIVDNPERLRYKVSVIDHRQWPMYEEFTNHNQYRRRLDLSGLSSTTFQVLVQIDNQRFVYQLNKQVGNLIYTIQPQSTANALSITE